MQLNKNNILILLVIAVMGFAVYSNSLSNQFTYDDFDTVAGNKYISSPSNLRHLFSARYFDMSGEKTYRPVATVSYFLDYSLWGLKAWGYHLTNILLHILASLLVYLFCQKIFPLRQYSLFAFLIFIIHPINTEAVNAIAFREEMLFTIFFISSILAYDNFARGAGKKLTRLCISVLFFILSLFSKEQAVILPLVIILYDYFFIRIRGEPQTGISRISGRLRYILIYISISILFFAFARYFYALYMVKVSRFYSNFFPLDTFGSEVLTRLYVIAYYIKLLFIPVGLCADYFIKAVSSLQDTRALWAVFIVTLTIISAVFFRRRARYISFGILWFYVTLIPVANIFPIGNAMAERFLYLPSIGFCIALSWLIAKTLEHLVGLRRAKTLRLIFISAVIGMVIFYSYNTNKRSEDWRNNFTLWQDTARASPLSSRAHNNLGVAYAQAGDYNNAKQEYKAAIELYPFYAEVHNNLGSLYRIMNDPSAAIRELSIAKVLMPENANIRRNLAEVFSGNGQYSEAVTELNKAIELDPAFERAHYDLAVAYEGMGDFEQAVREHNKTLKLNPYYSGVRFELGLLYYKMGKIGDARSQWLKALEITPGFEQARVYLERTGQDKSE